MTVVNDDASGDVNHDVSGEGQRLGVINVKSCNCSVWLSILFAS